MLYDIKFKKLNNNEKFTYTVDAQNKSDAIKNFFNIQEKYNDLKNIKVLKIVQLLKKIGG